MLGHIRFTILVLLCRILIKDTKVRPHLGEWLQLPRFIILLWDKSRKERAFGSAWQMWKLYNSNSSKKPKKYLGQAKVSWLSLTRSGEFTIIMETLKGRNPVLSVQMGIMEWVEKQLGVLILQWLRLQTILLSVKLWVPRSGILSTQLILTLYLILTQIMPKPCPYTLMKSKDYWVYILVINSSSLKIMRVLIINILLMSLLHLNQIEQLQWIIKVTYLYKEEQPEPMI
jgi:hypothetical protein